MATNLKTEYVASDGFRFTEEQKELAEKYQHHLDLFDAVKNYSSDFIEVIRESSVVDEELKNSLIALIQIMSNYN